MTPHHSPTKNVSRRAFLQTTGTAAAALYGLSPSADQDSPGKPKVIVGAHPWVYAATRPGYDITPILPQIFADMKYAGLDGIELMHNVLLEDDAVARIGRLSREHDLPVIGTSFGGAMWDKGDAVIELAHERDFKPTRPLRDSLKMSRRFVRETMGY